MKRATKIITEESHPHKEISWRAVLAGTIIVLSILLILNLLGFAIGLGTIEPTEETNPMEGVGTISLIFWIVSNLIALFAGGYVAARVGISFRTESGIIQGILTWALYTIISAWLLTSMVGSIISGVGNLVGNVVSGVGQTIGDTLGPVVEKQLEEVDISLDEAKNEFYRLLEDTGKEELQPQRIQSQAQRAEEQARQEAQNIARRPASSDAEIERIFRSAINPFENSFEALDKQALVNILVERTDMTQQEAEQTVDGYIAQYENLRAEFEKTKEEVKAKVNEHAEKAAETAAKVSLYLAIALIIGGLVAGIGGFLGAKDLRDDYTRRHYEIEETENIDRNNL